MPHINPQSWLVLESGIPRLRPTYFAAYCWNRSPITQMNPPAASQNNTDLAPASCCQSSAGPPAERNARAVIMPSSPTLKKATNESGFIPVRYALRYGIYMVPHSTPAPRAATMPWSARPAGACAGDATASKTAPANMSAAPPSTPSHRRQPASRSSWKKTTLQKIPSRLFMFHNGNAMLSPMSRIAKIVSVLVTAQRHAASTAHTIRCGACCASAYTWLVPRASAGRLQRARNTPTTISSEISTGDTPACTSFVGASAAPSHAPAASPHIMPRACSFLSREFSSAGMAAVDVVMAPRPPLADPLQQYQPTYQHDHRHPPMWIPQHDHPP